MEWVDKLLGKSISLIDNTIFVFVNQFLVYDADVKFEGHVIKNITGTNDNDAIT